MIQGQAAQLVLEFIPGRTLQDTLELNGNRPFPISVIIEWAKAICEVLEAMHNHAPPIIHRDLKPDNIMLLEDERSIKMIDFGAARELARGTQERAKKLTGLFTEGYAPPEQEAGKAEERSDLYALAATLYHLATGKEPTKGFHTAREIQDQLNHPGSSIQPHDRWFFALLCVNLSEDVNQRYSSVQELRADLEAQRVTWER